LATVSTAPYPETPDVRTDIKSSSSSSSSSTAADDDQVHDPRDAILNSALRHVQTHGWTAAALARGAKDNGLHSTAAGMFPRGGAELVEHFMQTALQDMRAACDAQGEDFALQRPEERLKVAIEARLRALAPHLQSWPKAMALGVRPENAANTATALATLADELAKISGDTSSDATWYARRAMIGSIYVAAELFMLNDSSEDHRETWCVLVCSQMTIISTCVFRQA
jgi:ubiquinone biosynthesis protein COQ9